MKFSKELKPLVDRAGGAPKAAKICGVTEDTVYKWLRDAVEPNDSTKAGALSLLRTAVGPAPILTPAQTEVASAILVLREKGHYSTADGLELNLKKELGLA